MGRLAVNGSSMKGLCRIFVVPLHQSPLDAHRVGFAEVSQLSSIVSTWPSSYSIVVVLWPRSLSKDIGISRCSRGSNNAFSTYDELESDNHFQVSSGPYRFVESGRCKQSSVYRD